MEAPRWTRPSGKGRGDQRALARVEGSAGAYEDRFKRGAKPDFKSDGDMSVRFVRISNFLFEAPYFRTSRVDRMNMRNELRSLTLICVCCSTEQNIAQASQECLEANHLRMTWSKPQKRAKPAPTPTSTYKDAQVTQGAA